MWHLVVLVLFAFGTALYLYKLYKLRRLPPGPPSLPLIGSLPWVIGCGKTPFYKLASAWDRQNGAPGIVTFDFGFAVFIVLNRHDRIRRAFVDRGDQLSERPVLPYHSIINPRGLGIMPARGEKWVQTRRLTLRCMKVFGLDRPIVEQSIADQVEFLRHELDSYAGRPVHPSGLFKRCTSDILAGILIGYKPNAEGRPRFDILDAVDTFVRDNATLFTFFPFLVDLLRIPYVRSLFASHKSVDSLLAMLAFFRQQIAQHRATASSEPPGDFIDAFLAEQTSPCRHNSTRRFPEDILSDENLAHILIALFLAGTNTVADGLAWTSLLLAVHPQVQTRVREEIVRVIGQHRRPSMGDADALPYCQAVLSEIYRCGSMTGLTLPHTSLTDVRMGGEEDWMIPSGSYVLANLYHVNRDPSLWPEPERFDPCRFLHPHTGAFVPNENLIVFSVGRRACLGEKLGRTMMFLFFVSIFQSYWVTLGPEQKFPLSNIMTGETRGIGRAPKEFYVSYTPH